jgi:hypothetical protein
MRVRSRPMEIFCDIHSRKIPQLDNDPSICSVDSIVAYSERMASTFFVPSMAQVGLGESRQVHVSQHDLAG